MFNLLWVFIAMQAMFGCKQAEPETYLISESFKGKVNIIFNQEKGALPKYENGRRVYEIPISGVLLTQFKDEYGLGDHQFYYVNSAGKRTALKVLHDDIYKDSTSTANRDEIGIFYDGTTGVYGNSGDPKALHYQEFVVTDFNSLDSFFKSENQNAFKARLKEAIGYDF